MERTTIAIEGMSCGHCVAAVRGALGRIDGVSVEEVKIGSATVSHDPARVPAARLVEAVEEEGYTARSA